MNILAINGSPHGKSGNTGFMIEAVLEGFRETGAHTTSIELSEKKIGQCRACHSCWFRTPGRCVLDDDMGSILDRMRSSDILIFGSPLHFCNVSGHLKTFFDRMTAAGGDPHRTQPDMDNVKSPGYIMISNCGFAERRQFDAVSLWINRVAFMAQARLLAEFYAEGGKILTAPDPEKEPARDRYLEYLKDCSRELALNGKLSAEQSTLQERAIWEF